jgi:hypothetical protein
MSIKITAIKRKKKKKHLRKLILINFIHFFDSYFVCFYVSTFRETK